jgi:hypothetical protein
MKMQTILAAACLALVLSIGPARAQKEYSLTFSVHKDVVGLTPELVEGVLQDASKILQEASKTLKDNNCNVTFKLDGPIKPFTSAAPGDISGKDDLEAVHREVADVKVVRSIGFCVGQKGQFEGCAWRRDGPKTVIVTLMSLLRSRGVALLHEFGHTTGLVHRPQHAALMKCNLAEHHVKVNETECSCFRAGPGGCKIPEPDPSFACSEDQQ